MIGVKTGDRVVSDKKPARIGGRREYVPLPTFEKGGTDGPVCVKHLWMDYKREGGGGGAPLP